MERLVIKTPKGKKKRWKDLSEEEKEKLTKAGREMVKSASKLFKMLKRNSEQFKQMGKDMGKAGKAIKEIEKLKGGDK